ncbi:hypothetical protein LS70_002855 [Helicobacter sp. MIT 11-5569]|uniref:hypothetical protein n=1 Tax=Helicobacter sp. MIT 11-5569 TaxID=1548151 RepID=UPI0010FEFACF|nr:hypothetical protein [Helicobacter sp. MIT 11-5569]TLD84504.1 hypothetical protein LS70_002855 [Helicobacter sp. MIT 11-5569]
MLIDTKLQYRYTSSSIRPLQVQEYFPLQITHSKTLLNHPIICPPPPQNTKKARFKQSLKIFER